MNRPGVTSRAFTLLEVLVAMALVSLVAGAMYTSLHVAFKARQSTVKSLEPITAARVAMDQVVRDVQAMLPPVGVMTGAMLGQDARNDQGFDADTLSFYNAAGPAQKMAYAQNVQYFGDVQQVQWSLMTGVDWNIAKNAAEQTSAAAGMLPGELAVDDGQMLLVRQVGRRMLTPVALEPVPQVYARAVRSLNLRYYDGSQWLDEWDSTTRDNNLPLAVEVTLEFEPEVDARNPNAVGIRLVQVVRPACAVRSELILEEAAILPPPEP